MNSKKAFTLIEIIIAIVIFAIGILAVFRLVTTNLKLMDTNNMRTQAMVLAKEWIELVYNLRDANREKELSWNCLMNLEMYNWDSVYLNMQAGLNNNEESLFLCDWYFVANDSLKVAFDEDFYVWYEKIDVVEDDFDVNFGDNRLYINTWDEGDHYLKYFNHDGVWEATNFARYITFDAVTEKESSLPKDKLLKVVSHVLYQKWTNTWEVVFESFIWNY